MKMRGFEYHRAATLDDALATLSEFGDDAKVLAGGQSLVPMMAMRLSSPAHLVDTGKLTTHDTITETDGMIAIGMRVTHAALEQSALIATAVPLAHAAAPHIGHRAIRNRGTVCGSIAHADPAAELPAVAVSLNAQLVVRSTRGERIVNAADFFHGYLTTALEPDELLTEVRFPKRGAIAGASVHEVSRRNGDFALVGVAVHLEFAKPSTKKGAAVIANAGIGLFGLGGIPIAAVEAQSLLVGNPTSDDLFAAAADAVMRNIDPMPDNHATAQYRRHVAGVLTRRALADATNQALAAS